jgi:hypothetical protein
MDGRTSGGPDMSYAQEPLRRSSNMQRYPHQQIGEGQISKQLPLSDDPLQVANRRAGQLGVPAEQLAQRRYGGSPPRRGDLIRS